MRRFILAASLAALLVPAAPAAADPPPWAPAHGRRDKDARADWRRYDWNRPDPRYRVYYADRYYRDGRYYRPRVLTVNDRIYRGHDGRYYCRRDDGTTGLILGAIAGGLLGNRIARGGSRTLGTLIGGGAGALIGRELDRGDIVCR